MEKDDEAALKFHQGVVQGELRKKRKNRFGLDDSDEEDEEDDRARRIRRKMREKTERGDIQELGMVLQKLLVTHGLLSIPVQRPTRRQLLSRLLTKKA